MIAGATAGGPGAARRSALWRWTAGPPTTRDGRPCARVRIRLSIA